MGERKRRGSAGVYGWGWRLVNDVAGYFGGGGKIESEAYWGVLCTLLFRSDVLKGSKP